MAEATHPALCAAALSLVRLCCTHGNAGTNNDLSDRILCARTTVVPGVGDRTHRAGTGKFPLTISRIVAGEFLRGSCNERAFRNHRYVLRLPGVEQYSSASCTRAQREQAVAVARKALGLPPGHVDWAFYEAIGLTLFE